MTHWTCLIRVTTPLHVGRWTLEIRKTSLHIQRVPSYLTITVIDTLSITIEITFFPFIYKCNYHFYSVSSFLLFLLLLLLLSTLMLLGIHVTSLRPLLSASSIHIKDIHFNHCFTSFLCNYLRYVVFSPFNYRTSCYCSTYTVIMSVSCVSLFSYSYILSRNVSSSTASITEFSKCIQHFIPLLWKFKSFLTRYLCSNPAAVDG